MKAQNTVLRTNFATGIVSPGIWNRTDWNRHSSSVREAQNFLVSPSGGMRKRPGTWYLDDCMPVVIEGVRYPSYLITFEFAVGQSYLLEFGQDELGAGIMRFWIDDHLIIDPSTNEPYTIYCPYTYFQVLEMSHAQYKDAMFCTHWDGPIRRLTRYPSATHTDWRWDTVIVERADLVTAPSGVRLNVNGHNGVSYAVTAFKGQEESRGGYGAVAAYDPGRTNPTDVPSYSSDKDQLFVNVDSWINKWYNQYGGMPGFPYIPQWLRDAYENQNPASGLSVDNTISWSGSGYQSRATMTLRPEVVARLSNLGYTTGGLKGIAFTEQFFFNGNYQPITATYYFWAIAKGGVSYAVPICLLGFTELLGNVVFEIFNGTRMSEIAHQYPSNADKFMPTKYAAGSGRLWNNQYTGMILEGSTVYTQIMTPVSPTGKVAVDQHGGAFNYSTPGFTTNVLVGLIASGKLGTASTFTLNDIRTIYDQCLAFIETGTVRPNNVVAWNATPGATSYAIYRNIHADTVNTGFYLMTTVPATQLTFEDTNVNETGQQLNKSPHEAGNFFNSPTTYPHVCSFFQQRLLVASTKESPLMIGGSTPGFFEDFLMPDNPLDTSGAFRYELTSKTSNPIKHIIPLRGVYVLTESGAFATPSDTRIDPSNVSFNQKAFNGSSQVPVVLVDQSALYVPLNRQMICALAYDSIVDGFTDDNMLFAAQHLMTGTQIRSVAYIRPVSSLVACVLEDGRCLMCTYIPRQEFMGWTELTTEGAFRQVVSATNSLGFDEFYFTAWRNGKYVVEKMGDTRPLQDTPHGGSVYLDSAVKGVFVNPISTVTSGLDHLEGMKVGVVINGSVYETKTVEDGQISLNEPAYDLVVGLPYQAMLETLDLEIQGVPTLRGTIRHILRARVECENTSDLEYQINDGKQYAIDFNTNTQIGLTPVRRTADIDISGSADYVNGTRLKFISNNPLPCAVNSVVAEVQVAED